MCAESGPSVTAGEEIVLTNYIEVPCERLWKSAGTSQIDALELMAWTLAGPHPAEELEPVEAGSLPTPMPLHPRACHLGTTAPALFWL